FALTETLVVAVSELTMVEGEADGAHTGTVPLVLPPSSCVQFILTLPAGSIVRFPSMLLHFTLPLSLNCAASETAGIAAKPHTRLSQPMAVVVIRFISFVLR